MANARQERILTLIREHDVTTQERLKELLEADGFSVTQATISRDIRQLQLRKEPAPSGGQRYCRPTVGNGQQLMTHSIKKIDYAMNTVVILCHVGTAQAVCASLDTLSLPMVIGTIAGDDTIFAMTRSEQNAKELTAYLQSHIWGAT